MRTLIISAITCLLMASCQNDGVKNGWTEANLKGKVKSFEESRYDAEERFVKIEKGNLHRWEFYKYDEQGNMIEASKYNLYESPDFKAVYEYDSRDNWIKKIRYNTRRFDPGNMGDTTKPEIPYSIWERDQH
ncbi:MAG: hypothetical protein P8M19_05675 [Crocinitomicaceae bacterium]|nr:hypothetical protein [Crocinitomicaceae bacterium]